MTVARTFLPAPPPPPGRPRLVVAGFMGTGKSVSGRLAAERLGFPFLDLDAVIEARAGRPVAEIFAEEGEPAFRRVERQVVAEASRISWAVVATGGGAPVDRTSFGSLARDSVVAVLTCEPAELANRLPAGDGRPLLGHDPPSRIDDLLRTRAEDYAEAGSPLDTTGRSPEAVAANLVRRYRDVNPAGSPAAITVEGPDGDYPVLVGAGVLASLGEQLGARMPDCRAVAVIADPAAAPIADRASSALAHAGFRTVPVAVPSGEEAKGAAVLAELWTELRRARLDATDAVVAVGGGATLDVAGFAAATYVRGVSWVTVPTTLLAMVDACLGGKVGIDHAGAKNLAGVFHHPRLVLADPGALEGQPDAALRGGLAEAVKSAVLASPLLLEVIERDGLEHLEWTIEQAVRIKAAYVGRDPRDRGLRRSLNLGHTFAHAIEAASGHAISHGDAVAAGLVAAARLGRRAGLTEEGLDDRLASLLARVGLLAKSLAELDRARLLEAMTADKKRRAGRAAFVVPAPGGAQLLEGVSPEEALASLLDREVSRS